MEDIGLEEEKPVVVRVKRKASQMPVDALWLEINERPLKRTQLDFGNLSTSTSSAVKEDLKTKKLLVQHVDTVSGSEGIENALQSFMKNIAGGFIVLKQMEHANVKPNSETFSYLISNCECEEDVVKTLLDCEVVLAPYREGNLKEKITPDAQKCIAKFHLDFRTSMADDLHTPVVLASLLEPLKTINTVLNSLKGKKQKQPLQIQSLVALEKEVKNVLTVLGLMSSSTCSEVLEQLKDEALKRAGLTEDEVLQQIEERALARKNKEYAKSDEIRKKLSDIGVALMDVPEGTIWRPCVPPEQQQPVGNSNDETETRRDDKNKT